MLTMSALPRFMRCPASACLPQIGRATEDGARGTAVHDAIEAVIHDPDIEWAAHDYGEPVDMATIRDWFPRLGEDLHIEPKVAWDVAARCGRIIERPGARNYGSVGPDEIPGSADLTLYDGQTGHLYVADIKTGWHQDALSGPAAENWQLRGLALALAGAIGAEPLPVYEVRAALLKVRADGRVDIDETTWTPDHLADFADELARAWAVRRPEAVVTSDWCAWCPAILSCPATVQAALVLAPPGAMDGLRVSTLVGALPPEAVAAALGHWRHLQRIGDAVEARAKHLAREGLLPGWRLVGRERREPHGGITHRVLMEMYGGDVATEAVEVTSSGTRITAALRGRRDRSGPYARGWLAEQERAVWAELAARGGVTVKGYEQLVEDKPALPAEGAEER